MASFLTLALIGLLAQLIDGSLGMAYGATSTTLLLYSGLTPLVASASVHLAEMGTTLISGLSHHAFGNIDWRTARRLGIPGAIGALIGAIGLSLVSTEAATPWMAGVLGLIGIYVFFRFAVAGSRRAPARRFLRGRYLAALGLAAGFVDATGGGGWGPITTPTLLATGSAEPRNVIGSVDSSEFLVAAAATLGFLLGTGGVAASVSVVLPLLAGGLIAAPIAAWLVRHLPSRILGVAAGGLIVVTNSHVLLENFEVPGSSIWLATLITVWVATILFFSIQLRRRLVSERPIQGESSGPSQLTEDHRPQ